MAAVMLDNKITWVPPEWNLPDLMNAVLEDTRPKASVGQGLLQEAYENRATYQFKEQNDYLGTALAMMLVVDEKVGRGIE